jgi:hypothetical protein
LARGGFRPSNGGDYGARTVELGDLDGVKADPAGTTLDQDRLASDVTVDVDGRYAPRPQCSGAFQDPRL